jgi:hypothetical protein
MAKDRTAEEERKMDVILHPVSGPTAFSLTNLYDRAISEALELFIVSAYLTEWKPNGNINKDCEEMSFIVGTDFGLTRKDACKAVLAWLPKEMKSDFLAADKISGFHPKLVLWKTKTGDCHLILGSSNLTQAAFSTNYEANAFLKIPKDEYDEIKEWVYSIRLQCSPISEDWLEGYKEADKAGQARGGKKPAVIALSLPSGEDINEAVKRRKAQQKAFMDIRDALIGLINKCAGEKVTNETFYTDMMALWGHHTSRFQGRGFEILGKHSDWKDTCASLSAIIAKGKSASVVALDNVVRKEIDRLASLENPNRGAGLSEMLCHFFPARYPILNKAVRVWLQHNKFRGPHKASEGALYIDLSMKLRDALASNKTNTARDLSELDHAIWQWYDREFGEE